MSKKIKELKYRYKKGEFKNSETTIEVDSQDEVKEFAFLSAFANYLDIQGIKEPVIDYLDDALSGNKQKSSVASSFAEGFEDEYNKSELSKLNIKKVKIIGV